MPEKPETFVQEEEDVDMQLPMASGNDSQNDEENYEYIEEEFFVVASLPDDAISKVQNSWKRNKEDGISDQEETADSSADPRTSVPKYAIIDVDTERPMLEIEGIIYQGVPDELLGTSMLFDIGTDSSESMRAELVGTTSRVIHFHPVKFHRK
ncbi:hypothetical protein GGI23_006880 [Coemansia sp. RSA 2559]|nr:hypothetical protein GGI23_006880 [Coemansia sp. RSA 2559]